MPFLFFFKVCETIYHESQVTESVPVCREVLETVCQDGEGEGGEEICKDYAKQLCDVEEQTVTKRVPETKCQLHEVEVCGPEPCPLTNTEKVCSDEIKEVRVNLTLKNVI